MAEIHPAEFRRVYKGKAGSGLYHLEGELGDYELDGDTVTLMALDVEGDCMFVSTRGMGISPSYVQTGSKVQVSAEGNGDGMDELDARFMGIFQPKRDTPVCFSSDGVQ